MRKSIFLPVIASLLSVAYAGAVQASGRAVTIRVPHGDLDLTSARDTAVLKRRIVTAVDRACRSHRAYSGSFVLTDPKCRADALEAAFAVMERRRAVQVAAAD